MNHAGIRLVMAGGALAATLDILYAMAFYGVRHGVPPGRILQSVASGVLGKDAYAAGWPAALLGLGLHFFIAMVAALVYFAAAQRLPVMRRRAWLCGAGFGVLVFGFMNLLVLPLSRFPGAPSFAPAVLVGGLLAHIFLVGMPIAVLCRAALARR